MSNQSTALPSPSTSNAPLPKEVQEAIDTKELTEEPREEPKEEQIFSSCASVSSSASSVTLPTPATAKDRVVSFWRRVANTEYLMQDIHPGHATFLLFCFCFMSGFVNSVPFTAVLLWCGFQTGNTVQLAIAIGRFLDPQRKHFTFEVADQQALISLLSYLGGGFAGRFGDRIGSNKRAWLLMGTLWQALLTMAAALTIWKSGEPSISDSRGEDAWKNALSFVSLAFASASQGLQGVMAKRVNSHFGATVVLTTLWSELIGDPDLFRRKYTKSRDHRLLSVLGFVLGGIFGRGLLNRVGSAAVFGIATALRVVIAFAWLFVPAR